MFSFRPLRVVAHLSTPIAGNPSVYLDAVLLYHACKRHYGGVDVKEAGQQLDYDPALVPLEIIDPDGTWFYACSSSIMPNRTAVGTVYWNKRFDDRQALEYGVHKSINTAAGEFKQKRDRALYTHMRDVTWLVRGDKESLEDLLTDCIQIGRNRAQGFGMVERWEVSELADDYSIMFGDKPMRPIPKAYYLSIVPQVPAYVSMAHLAFRPPYYYPQNQGEVFVGVV